MPEQSSQPPSRGALLSGHVRAGIGPKSVLAELCGVLWLQKNVTIAQSHVWAGAPKSKLTFTIVQGAMGRWSLWKG